MYFLEPPGAAQNLTVKFVDQSNVILSWNPPSFLGGRNDTTYHVVCGNCGPSVTYSPRQNGLNQTQVAVSGLTPVTTYWFKVFSKNGVSSIPTFLIFRYFKRTCPPILLRILLVRIIYIYI